MMAVIAMVVVAMMIMDAGNADDHCDDDENAGGNDADSGESNDTSVIDDAHSEADSEGIGKHGDCTDFGSA